MTRGFQRAIGLMSGTSGDGVDAALIETDGENIRSKGPYHFVEYSAVERAAILAHMQAVKEAPDHKTRLALGAEISSLVTDRHYEAVTGLLSVAGLESASIDVIGFHGQTLYHDPCSAFTLQVGDAGRLASELGIRVVYDMRGLDMAAGGEGAPLVPVYHRALVRSAGLALPVAVVNIGGVANVTYAGAGDELLAFDTGPGNVLIDEWVGQKTGRRFDDRGGLAGAGVIDETALSLLMSSPYLTQQPPKSLDRYDFSFDAVEALSVEDGAATLVEFTARSIIEARHFMEASPRVYVIVGGGVRNDFLMQRLSALSDVPVLSGAELGWAPGYVEAEAFGFLAVRHLYQLPLTFPGTTGVKAPQTGGRLALPG